KDGNSLEAGIVTVYNVAPVTNEYIWKSEEYLPIGVGVPAHSYIDKPPVTSQGFAICRTAKGDGWEYIADHRGEMRFSTVTKKPLIITELGDYPANTTDIAPAEFEQWDGNKWVSDEAARIAAIRQTAASKKAELKAVADSEIEWRQDAVDDKSASTKEIADLAAWRKYRLALMRVDTSNPLEIEWPVAPE
ncbi:tail fiber assembly protein, partial [Yersinia sp. LJYL362]|uniref:tail fiber assembly protein n=1 Tax=Yersinia sp. LJYL362 TaxID=3402108 RepID=UPI003AB6B4BF